MRDTPTIKVVGPNMGFWTIIGIVFITLKLCKVIDWSWWLVLMPIYLPFALFLLLALIASVLVFIMCLPPRCGDTYLDRPNRKRKLT